MLYNYITIAVRNLLMYKGYSAINILGLTIGMASCILVLLFVQDEFQYDAFHKDASQIHRVVSKVSTQDGVESISVGVSGQLGPTMAEEFPDVEAYMRIYLAFDSVWFLNSKHVGLEDFCLADPNMFEFFSFVLLKGDAKTVLKKPFTAVISESMARKYFGQENPIGKVITAESGKFGGDYKVTGVMQDFPAHSTLQMDFVTATVQSGEVDKLWNTWYEMSSWRPIQTFVRLNAAASKADLELKLSDLARRNDTRGDARKTGSKFEYFLQPMPRIHLFSNADYGILAPQSGPDKVRNMYGDIKQIYLLSLIAVFVLVIGCINFMNSTTARSERRAREVGLRKVLGGHHKELIRQFLSESIFVALLALILALILVQLVLPAFNEFMGKSLSLVGGGQMLWFARFLGIAIFVGLLAGSYPAFYLSSFQPATVLKESFRVGGRGASIRKGLVVLQFSLSILLIIGTVIAYRQLAYMQNKELGFQKEHVVMLPIFFLDRLSGVAEKDQLVFRHQAVKEAFMAHPNVEAATMCRAPLGVYAGHHRILKIEGLDDAVRLPLQTVDDNFIDFFGIELIAGRNFRAEEMHQWAQQYIVNEAAVKAFGWSDPIGKEIQRRESIGTVIGVVKDFHHRSLHQSIEPLAFIPIHAYTASLALRIRTERFPETVSFLRDTWDQFLPNRPFEFFFLDTRLNRSYEAEQRLFKATGVFAIMAIGLACLGLFGLTAFMTEQRKKEIAVRKVLGASVASIMSIFLREFSILVLGANFIAWPIAYFLAFKWLENFAYRIDLAWWMFGLGGLLSLLIALLTVGYQAVRSALSNTVDVLRH